HPSQQIRTRKNGAVELEFEAAGLFEVQRWVLSWGSQVQVLAPKELQSMMLKEVASMAAWLRIK
ncbi:MAG: WYL domain-containing protein, partial [bacterium]